MLARLRGQPFVNVPGNPHADEKTIKLRVDGFSTAELDAIVATKDVRIGAVGVTTVNSVAVSTVVNPKNGMPDLSAEALAKEEEGFRGVGEDEGVGGMRESRSVINEQWQSGLVLGRRAFLEPRVYPP